MRRVLIPRDDVLDEPGGALGPCTEGLHDVGAIVAMEGCYYDAPADPISDVTMPGPGIAGELTGVSQRVVRTIPGHSPREESFPGLQTDSSAHRGLTCDDTLGRASALRRQSAAGLSSCGGRT